jgi:hypothetical protein
MLATAKYIGAISFCSENLIDIHNLIMFSIVISLIGFTILFAQLLKKSITKIPTNVDGALVVVGSSYSGLKDLANEAKKLKDKTMKSGDTTSGDSGNSNTNNTSDTNNNNESGKK